MGVGFGFLLRSVVAGSHLIASLVFGKFFQSGTGKKILIAWTAEIIAGTVGIERGSKPLMRFVTTSFCLLRVDLLLATFVSFWAVVVVSFSVSASVSALSFLDVCRGD